LYLQNKKPKNHMNSHYKISQSTAFLKQKLLLMLLFLAGVANAQLSGSYTINAGSATSGTNFNNWRDLGSALSTSGVSGAVTITVQTDVTASSPAVFAAISGASSTNTITIDGGSKLFTYSGTYEAISFTGADYVTIKNAIVRNSATGTYAGLIRFSGASNYNKIDNCTLEFSALASATTGTYYVAMANSATGISSPTSATNGISNTVSNCTMRTLATNSAGPFFGVSCMGNTSTYSSTGDDNTFTNNKIQNFYYYGIINYYTNGNQFVDNDIMLLVVLQYLPVLMEFTVFIHTQRTVLQSSVVTTCMICHTREQAAVLPQTTSLIGTVFTPIIITVLLLIL
jgi:hypothetical protein